MAKLVWLVLVAIVACRLLIGRWPWALLTPGRRTDGGKVGPAERARALLGVDDTAARDEIIQAHRRLIARVHPDHGGTNEAVHEANAARDLLLVQQAAPTTERP